MHFRIIVEGLSEHLAITGFLKHWLDERLNNPIQIKTTNFSGFGNFKKDIVKRSRKHLDGPDNDQIIAVIGLIDLYVPQSENFYPNDKITADQRYQWAVRHFEKQVDRPKFRMFLAVHEFEAWLFCQPDVFPSGVDAFVKRAVQQKSPETINFDNPPSKRLKQYYRQTFRNKSYNKPVEGKRLFEKMSQSDVGSAYNQCPYLRIMLDEMLQLAKTAGL